MSDPNVENNLHCGHEGCESTELISCFLHDNADGTPDEYYCGEHVRDAGYCPGCGNFWAGCESFDFSPSGYCENCASEFDDESEDIDDENYWDFREYDGAGYPVDHGSDDYWYTEPDEPDYEYESYYEPDYYHDLDRAYENELPKEAYTVHVIEIRPGVFVKDDQWIPF